VFTFLELYQRNLACANLPLARATLLLRYLCKLLPLQGLVFGDA
jgi:hypothetical protein